MCLITVDEFKSRFDAYDQGELKSLVDRGISSVEQIDLTDYLKDRPSKDTLCNLAESVSKMVRANYPDSSAVWKEYRQPILDIKPLREAYCVRFNDDRKKVVQNPYSGGVCFEIVPVQHLSAHLGSEDTAVAVADNHAIIAARKIRVTDSKLEVVSGILQYELFPYFVSAVGLEKAEKKQERFFEVLSVMIGGLDAATMLGEDASDAKTLYERCGNPQRLLAHMKKQD